MNSSPNIMWVIKSRIMRYVGHIGHVGESRNAHRVLVGKLRERDHWEDLGINGNLILQWIFKKYVVDLAEDRDRWNAVINLRIS